MSSPAARFVADIVTVATAGTAVALGTGKARKLKIKALAGNTGALGVGESDVDSTNWYELSPGDELILDNTSESGQSEMFEFDLANVYLDAATNGNAASISYIRF